jgi:hypothetical protein
MFRHVDIEDVRAVSRRDLIDEWLPKLEDPDAFQRVGCDSDHLRANAVLTMCRILQRAAPDGVVSKRVAPHWVKVTYGEPCKSLVTRAEDWQRGKTMASDQEVKGSIAFTAQTVGVAGAQRTIIRLDVKRRRNDTSLVFGRHAQRRRIDREMSLSSQHKGDEPFCAPHVLLITPT